MTVKNGATAGQPDKAANLQETIKKLQAETEQLRGELARLEEKLRVAEELADRDPLLPVLNRRAFFAGNDARDCPDAALSGARRPDLFRH